MWIDVLEPICLFIFKVPECLVIRIGFYLQYKVISANSCWPAANSFLFVCIMNFFSFINHFLIAFGFVFVICWFALEWVSFRSSCLAVIVVIVCVFVQLSLRVHLGFASLLLVTSFLWYLLVGMRVVSYSCAEARAFLLFLVTVRWIPVCIIFSRPVLPIIILHLIHLRQLLLLEFQIDLFHLFVQKSQQLLLLMLIFRKLVNKRFQKLIAPLLLNFVLCNFRQTLNDSFQQLYLLVIALAVNIQALLKYIISKVAVDHSRQIWRLAELFKDFVLDWGWRFVDTNLNEFWRVFVLW